MDRLKLIVSPEYWKEVISNELWSYKGDGKLKSKKFDLMAEKVISSKLFMPVIQELEQRIKELEEERKWIPVSERMPEIRESNFSDRVLVILSFGYIRVTEYDGELKQWYGLVFQEVTHWQPLPSIPTK
jgi:hypothetical protein